MRPHPTLAADGVNESLLQPGLLAQGVRSEAGVGGLLPAY